MSLPSLARVSRVASARIGSLNARLPKKGWSRSSAVTQSLTRRADSERAAIMLLPCSRPRARSSPANCALSASASRLTCRRRLGSKRPDGRRASGSIPANLSFTSRHSMARSSSAKMLSRGTTSTSSLMFSIRLSRNTRGLPFSSSRKRSPTRSTASPRRR